MYGVPRMGYGRATTPAQVPHFVCREGRWDGTSRPHDAPGDLHTAVRPFQCSSAADRPPHAGRAYPSYGTYRTHRTHKTDRPGRDAASRLQHLVVPHAAGWVVGLAAVG